jgi:hypothetical protein
VHKATFTIRRAVDADAETIAQAHVQAIHSTGALFYSPEVVADWSAPLKPELYCQAMANGVSFLPIVRHTLSAIGGQALSPEWGPLVFGR